MTSDEIEAQLIQIGDDWFRDMLTLQENMPWIQTHAKEINAVVKLGKQGKLEDILAKA